MIDKFNINHYMFAIITFNICNVLGCLHTHLLMVQSRHCLLSYWTTVFESITILSASRSHGIHVFLCNTPWS